jgi:hypothetical protein
MVDCPGIFVTVNLVALKAFLCYMETSSKQKSVFLGFRYKLILLSYRLGFHVSFSFSACFNFDRGRRHRREENCKQCSN